MSTIESREPAVPTEHAVAAEAAVRTGVSGAAEEVRISVVTGDRLCARCAYNLTGQLVTREPHYGLLIVRCPECATVASIQEYPLLGRWANRWGAVLAVVCLIFLLGMWLASSAATFGWTLGTAEGGSRRYGDYLEELMSADLRLQAAAAVGTA